MAVRIRLKKLGRRHRPYYRICVMDSRTPRDGKTIEEIGTYDPMIKDTNKRVTLRAERVDYWLKVGALPTDKVKVLIDKFKGKVADIRIDKPVERTLPPLPAPSERKPKQKPKAPEAAPAPEAGGAGEATAQGADETSAATAATVAETPAS